MAVTTLLLVSGDAELQTGLHEEAARSGWAVRVTQETGQTMRGLYEWDPDAVVLDLGGVAAVSDWSLLVRIREVSDLPVLVVSGRADSRQSIAAFKHGADDVVSRDCPAAEIMLRVRNLARNYRRWAGDDTARTYCYGSLTFDAFTRRVATGDRAVDLTQAEALLLQRFLREPDRVLTPTELAAALWRESGQRQARSIKVYVLRLRRKLLACDPQGRYIANHRTVGYRFQAR